MREALSKIFFSIGAATLAALFFLQPAFALTSSERAFRLEDRSEGNLVIGAKEAAIESGEIYKTVVLLWGDLEVYGQVEELVILSGRVTFHDGSRLTKSLVVMGGEFDSKPGAEVKGEDVVFRAPGPLWNALRSVAKWWSENFSWLARLGAALFSCLILWLLGLALFRSFPGLQAQTSDRLLREWPQNLLVGILGAFLVPALAVLLVLSIVGILLLPLFFLFLGLMAVISYMAAALWAGHRLLPPKPKAKINIWGYLLGILSLQFLWVVGVWWAVLPVLFLWALGWGSLLRSGRALWK